VARSLNGAIEGAPQPAWVGESRIRTDADGRFTIAFPPDQLADCRLAIEIMQVSHPDFVARRGRRETLATLLQGRKYGDEPFFKTIALERGMDYFGQVLTPDGQPAAGVPFEFGTSSQTNPSRHFSDHAAGQTDDQGRFRVRMAKAHLLRISLTPDNSAWLSHLWGTREPARNPEIWAPADLGRIVLERGATLSGRLLDRRGKPIAGQRIAAIVRRQVNRSREATTDLNGVFTFPAVRTGNYEILPRARTTSGTVIRQST
jgi:hypothetical protein